MKNEIKIKCKVHDCDYCDCDENECILNTIKVCNNNGSGKKTTTMCDSYKEKKEDK